MGIWNELLIAIFVALLFGIITVRIILKGKYSWRYFWAIFALIFMSTFAVGLWVTPVGGILWDYYWVPYVSMGIFMSLLLAATAPVVSKENFDKPLDGKDSRYSGLPVFLLGKFYWLMLFLLVVIISIGVFVK